MILQKIAFPRINVCTKDEMYFKGEDFSVFMEEAYCSVAKNAVIDTSTYFNSFSIGKWSKYTIINNLKLKLVIKGSFLVSVCHAYKIRNSLKNIVLYQEKFTSDELKCFEIPINTKANEGVFYFKLKALTDDSEFWGGSYTTDIDESLLSEVKIAIGICSFRREEYVANNMKMLRNEILENPKSPLYGNLEIFISDNGKTLPDSLNTDHIHIFPNKNVGGAGGFTRSMIEIKNASKDKHFTHIMMMDDDIRLNTDALIRTYTMLRLLKPEHTEAFIGGHMLKIDSPHIQSEAADHWDISGHHPVKYNYDLTRLDFLIKNEIEDSVNYFGWWYCCMPIGVVTDNNLPLPIFIKRDDIEYGLRNGKKFITLNGICVWHEPFEYKYATYLEYYYFRNMCIINSRHRMSFNADKLIKAVWVRTRDFLLRYRYRDAELSLLGVQHYLKGIDWLKSQDGEKLNGELMKLGYKKEPVSDIDFVFTHGAYEANIAPKKLNNRQKLIRKYTLNGWLLPANKSIAVPAYQPSITHFYGASKVLNYEEVSNTGFITTRDYKSLKYILKMFLETKKMIKKDYQKVTLEYRDRYDELININFWNDYLFDESDAPTLTSGLDKVHRPANTKAQRKELWVSRVLKLTQGLLYFLPVKKNRVMLYIHDRKGFTCNPKYIAKKLKEMYGEKIEIIWATMHPETCDEIKALGIDVIKSNSFIQFKKYLRTRFFITNDAFPSWAMHRYNQKWMNTWHAGMNYKHIGYDYLAPQSRIAAKLYKMKNKQPDFFLSGSEFFTKDTAKSFRIDESVFIPTGLPRNDIFFEEQTNVDKKVREVYNIPQNKRLVIFAPTFRRGMKSNTYGMDFASVRKAFEQRFGGEWVVLFRNHNFVKGKQKYAGAVDVSAYHDMQELMYAADALISDYSSCLYDFCMSKRPAFVYATDLNEYRSSDRSFAYDFAKWPYPVATSNDELVECIKAFDTDDYKTKVEEHLRDAGAYDNGDASEKTAKIIAEYCI